MTSPFSSLQQGQHFLERQSCPLCSSTMLTPFLLRENVPVLTNLLLESQETAQRIPRGTIHLHVCEQCGFVFNGAFDHIALYDDHYDNSQAFAPSFVRYLDERIHQIVTTQHIARGGCIVEVGCGDGFFLRRLIEAETETIGYGFDPSYRGPLSELDGRLHFQQRYYDERCSTPPADVLVCRHVIEHIPQPLPFFVMLRQSLVHSPQTRAFFETPTIEWILRHQVIWDIYYEHCSYFSPHTITFALEHAGFRVEHIEHTFGDQYLWVEATVDQSSHQTRSACLQPGSASTLAAQFQRGAYYRIEQWQATLHLLRQDGPVAILGAAGKGVALANLIDPTGELIDCVVDVNPHKHHKYLPGTGHHIVPYDALKTRGIVSALLLNPNYVQDVMTLLDIHQVSVRLITEQESLVMVAENGVQRPEEALDMLSAKIEQERLAGRTIVFTHGVFDLLHAGHLQLLRYAKTLGDILIVAVDTDESTRRLKGPDWPINNERNRLALVDALDMVDYVVLFESTMLAPLLRTLHPTIYLKGNDYPGAISPVADVLQEVGARSVIAPRFGNDLRTSRIIERIAALATHL